MKRIAIIVLLVLGHAFGQAPDGAVQKFQAEVARWDMLTTNTDTPVTTLKDQHHRLLAAWKHLGNGRSGSINQAIASANRDLVRRLVESESFEEADMQICTHVEFCAANHIGLIGGSKSGFREFAEAHAMIMASLGRDPLAEAKLPYEMVPTSTGFLAIAEWTHSDGRRATEINGDSVSILPKSETLSECVTLGKSGRLLETWFVGLTYPAGDRRPGQRLSSVYVVKEPGPEGPGGFVRKSIDVIRALEEQTVPNPMPETRSPSDASNVRIGQIEGAPHDDATSRNTVVTVMIAAGVLGILGFFLWRSRRV